MPHPRLAVAVPVRSAALAGLAGPLLAFALALGAVVSAQTSHADPVAAAPALEASAR